MATEPAPANDRMPLWICCAFCRPFWFLFSLAVSWASLGRPATRFPDYDAIALYGYIGVDWFFVISGFVIAWTAHKSQCGGLCHHALCPSLSSLCGLHVAYLFADRPLRLATLQSGLVGLFANLTMAAPLLGKPFMDGAYWSILVEIIFYGWVYVLLATGFWRHRISFAFAWLALSTANMAWLKIEALRFLLIYGFCALVHHRHDDA